DARRRSRSIFQFEWTDNQCRTLRRKLLEVGHVLDVINAVGLSGVVDFEIGRWTGIDAQRIDAESRNFPLHEALRRLLTETRKVQYAFRICVAIGLALAPACTPAGARDDDAAGRNRSVCF